MTNNPTIDGVSRELLLVPVEPTERMIRAGDMNYSWSVAKIYGAMIAAAPVVERQEPVAVVHVNMHDCRRAILLQDGMRLPEHTKLYTAPPQLAELQAENARLKGVEILSFMMESDLEKLKAERDELQSTIEQQAALLREAACHAARMEPMSASLLNRIDVCLDATAAMNGEPK